MTKESSDGLPDIWTAKDKAAYNRYQRALGNSTLPDVWTDKDKASYNKYQQSLQNMKETLAAEKDTGRAPVAPAPESKYIKGTPENKELKASRYGRGSGKAAPLDSEGGMSPGQSPSLYNPIKEKKGGSIKKKHGGSTTKVSTAKPSSKSSCW